MNDRGAEHTDVFWYWPGTFIMDAGREDYLKFFGWPLLGGTNKVLGFNVGDGAMAIDWTFFFVFYAHTKGGQLIVYNAIFDALGVGIKDLEGVMVVEDYNFGGYKKDSDYGRPEPGELGMSFRITLPSDAVGGLEISRLNYVWGHLLTYLDVIVIMVKALIWKPANDPLIIDLDGDGIETVSQSQSGVYFDMDGDFFAEATGWVSSDDGFVVLDRNGNGRIDDISEMFGGPDRSGFGDLAALDDNLDGVITIGDAGFAALRIWQDFDQDGVTDSGELSTLEEQGIVSLGLTKTDMDFDTPQGTHLFAKGDYVRADGSVGKLYDAGFEANSTDTIFRGEKGVAGWLKTSLVGTPGANGVALTTGSKSILPDAKGFGTMTSLAVAASNDFGVAEVVAAAAAAATVPTLKAIREAAKPVFGVWAQSLEQTRELTPVLLSAGGQAGATSQTLLDRAEFQEDSSGGYWTLKSGAAILDSNGNTIARATLADVMAQATANGQQWQLEQMFSPVTRATPLTQREAAPYLAEIIDGRAVVRDYGIENTDGSWRLASGTAITAADGTVITAPTIADIQRMALPTALAAAAQTAGNLLEWRTESLGHNPFAALTVDRMGVYFIDGRVVDYSVRVSDEDGSFDVWARNLDRALALQHKLGAAGEFNLRAYAIDFDTLDEVGSTEDSAYRVEILTAGQFHFATSAYGVDLGIRPKQKHASVLRRGGAGSGESIPVDLKNITARRDTYSRGSKFRFRKPTFPKGIHGGIQRGIFRAA